MARLLYGAGTADVVAVVSTVDGDYSPPTNAAVFDVYDAFTGGSAVTDLETVAGAAITQVTSDSDGRILFMGPDGTTGPLWLQDASDSGATRYLVNPSDVASRSSASNVITTVAGRTGDVVLDSDDITDATTTGKALLTASTAAAARTTLGVTATSDLAAVATSGDAADLSGTLNIAQLPAGVPIVIEYDEVGAAWPANPTSRTDIPFIYDGADEANPPPNARPGDKWDRPA